MSDSQTTFRKWQVISETCVEDFGIFSAKKSSRINPRTGQAYTFFLMDGRDWVNLIALTNELEVVLVRQYRHGAEAETLELPGGCVEKGEDPTESAKRELQEETGYNLNSIYKLGTLFANPAMQSIRLHCYIGFQANLVSAPKLDTGEDIQTCKIPLHQFLQLVQDGTVSHSLVVAATGLFLAKAFPLPAQLKDLESCFKL